MPVPDGDSNFPSYPLRLMSVWLGEDYLVYCFVEPESKVYVVVRDYQRDTDRYLVMLLAQSPNHDFFKGKTLIAPKKVDSPAAYSAAHYAITLLAMIVLPPGGSVS